MKVTQVGRGIVVGGLTGLAGGGGEISGTNPDTGSFPPSGQIPTSTGSNTWAWGSNIATVWANGSNQLMGPHIQLAAGSNIILTLDQGPGGSSPSNTLRIHSLGGSGGGVSAVTSNGSNSLTGTINLVAGTNIALGVSGQDITITSLASGGGGSGGSAIVDPFSDPNFTSSTGWTAVGAGSSDINSTYANHAYISFTPANSTTDAYTALYRSWTPSAGKTATIKLAGHNLLVAQQEVGVIVGQVSTGEAVGWGLYGQNATPNPAFHWRDFSSATSSVNDGNTGISPPSPWNRFGRDIWVRIRWDSNTSMDLLYSLDGFNFLELVANHNPTSAFTTDFAGCYVFPYGTTTAISAVFAQWEFT